VDLQGYARRPSTYRHTDLRPSGDAVSDSASAGRGSDPSSLVRSGDVRFGADGLVPVVVIDAGDGSVLMLAWMNSDALEQSLQTGQTVFWSRSRGELWAKGATSGHVQRIVGMRTDCDADALVVTVEQTGVACHTGERTCFHRELVL
jgi:phosphoribosyl-AMP cyclohydrolase